MTYFNNQWWLVKLFFLRGHNSVFYGENIGRRKKSKPCAQITNSRACVAKSRTRIKHSNSLQKLQHQGIQQRPPSPRKCQVFSPQSLIFFCGVLYKTVACNMSLYFFFLKVCNNIVSNKVNLVFETCVFFLFVKIDQ